MYHVGRRTGQTERHSMWILLLLFKLFIQHFRVYMYSMYITQARERRFKVNAPLLGIIVCFTLIGEIVVEDIIHGSLFYVLLLIITTFFHGGLHGATSCGPCRACRAFPLGPCASWRVRASRPNVWRPNSSLRSRGPSGPPFFSCGLCP